MIPTVVYATNVDELITYLFLGVAVFDSVVTGCWKKYSVLWVVLTIMMFYGVYSFATLRSNTSRAIIMDFVIQLKPYIAFLVIYCARPILREGDKRLIKRIAVFNCAVMSLALIMGDRVVEALVFHPAYAGLIVFSSVMYYLYCSIRPDGSIDAKDLRRSVIFLLLGLLCLKAKYYGCCIIAIYFMFFYRPGIMRHFSVKHVLILIGIAAVVLVATWNKIEYYFLTGESEKFDPDVVYTYARPVLYLTGFQILIDYFPFGSGLASIGTAGSILDYSKTYYEYGIDKVFGLSPNAESSFAMDTFYPVLAEFGVVGMVLFIFFWVWAYGALRKMIRCNPRKYKYYLAIGASIICMILIESVASVTFTGNLGYIAMVLFGMTCAPAKDLQEPKEANAVGLAELRKIGQQTILAKNKIKI